MCIDRASVRVPVEANFKHNCALRRRTGQVPGRRNSQSKESGFCALGGIDGQRSGVMQSSQVFAIFCIEVDMLARFVAFSLVIGSLFALAGCNTVDGVGQDISGAARTVKRAL